MHVYNFIIFINITMLWYHHKPNVYQKSEPLYLRCPIYYYKSYNKLNVNIPSCYFVLPLALGRLKADTH